MDYLKFRRSIVQVYLKLHAKESSGAGRLLTLSVTQVKCETNFSKLKLIKTRVRSTISQNILRASLLIMNVESDIADLIDNDTIINALIVLSCGRTLGQGYDYNKPDAPFPSGRTTFLPSATGSQTLSAPTTFNELNRDPQYSRPEEISINRQTPQNQFSTFRAQTQAPVLSETPQNNQYSTQKQPGSFLSTTQFQPTQPSLTQNNPNRFSAQNDQNNYPDHGYNGYNNQSSPSEKHFLPESRQPLQKFSAEPHSHLQNAEFQSQYSAQARDTNDGRYQSDAEEGDFSAIPGQPDVDYPILSDVPQTSFKCEEQQYPGYYADVETRCQVFHICANKEMYDFLCPNGTVFHQHYLVCVWWNQFDCNSAPSLYGINAHIYDYSRDVFSQLQQNVNHPSANLQAQIKSQDHFAAAPEISNFSKSKEASQFSDFNLTVKDDSPGYPDLPSQKQTNSQQDPNFASQRNLIGSQQQTPKYTSYQTQGPDYNSQNTASNFNEFGEHRQSQGYPSTSSQTSPGFQRTTSSYPVLKTQQPNFEHPGIKSQEPALNGHAQELPTNFNVQPSVTPQSQFTESSFIPQGSKSGYPESTRSDTNINFPESKQIDYSKSRDEASADYHVSVYSKPKTNGQTSFPEPQKPSAGFGLQTEYLVDSEGQLGYPSSNKQNVAFPGTDDFQQQRRQYLPPVRG
ncbi:hypothetical protein FQA39_LY11294 [Lamprigera yunnana]|nr:hypothetical protein FQA39_LY11294 [Lamprigera yunnana]